MQFLAISCMRTGLYTDTDFAPMPEDKPQRALCIEGSVRQIGDRGDKRGACPYRVAEKRCRSLLPACSNLNINSVVAVSQLRTALMDGNRNER